jgi:hypothetical protein
MTKGSIKKYLFILKDINIDKINSTYGIKIDQDGEENKVPIDEDITTKLSELTTSKHTPIIISFLDESKNSHACNVSMIDFNSKMNVNLLRYHCYWCKHPFETKPVGCPIKYVSSKAIKKYYSHITKDTYTIKEDITHDRRENLKEDNINVNTFEYYETDGVFCSFNCAKSYIDDNKHVRMYDQSDILLKKMYSEMICAKIVCISPAPHWRTLDHYGGHLNIIKFRESFNNIDYESHGIMKPIIPSFLPIGTLFEEKINF